VSHTIGKRFAFDAAHHLPSLPSGHKCARPHGHTYAVTVCLGAPLLSGPGFVTDFGDLAPFKEFLDTTFDHRDLNTVVAFEPTSERLAEYLAGWFVEHVQPRIPGRLLWLEVAETPTSWARYTLDSGSDPEART
jgi:6-pyruvoyltetrahydropterin/6-carboxytetrahydropterin synthase